MSKLTKKERKESTYNRALSLFRSNSKFVLVNMNNVTAPQLQMMKQNWRGTTDILLGKNTVIKKALDQLAKEDPKFTAISEIIKENVAFIFTTLNYKDLKKIMVEQSRNTYASVGMIAQEDVWIRKQLTSMGPERTKYFQALNIFTQITKGKVEIKSDCLALRKDEKVGPSQANLLTLLDIKPFTFFMQIMKVYENGIFYDPWIVDVDDEVIQEAFGTAVGGIVALGLGSGIATKPGVGFEIVNAFKDVISLSLGSGFETKESKIFN